MDKASTAQVIIRPRLKFGKVYARDARGVWPNGKGGETCGGFKNVSVTNIGIS